MSTPVKSVETASKSEAGPEKKGVFVYPKHFASAGLDGTVFQNEAGNLAVQRLLRAGTIQAKLTISHPDDPYEQEADRVADQVMTMPQAGISPQPT
jgi:hypothetical protein